jgi:uncharacterized protein YecT (DUF1311 family)
MLSPMKSAQAIDNPDAPDHQAAFLTRAKPYEERLSEASDGPASASAAAAYALFLDAEMNLAYRQLLARLDGRARQDLTLSQRRWLLFREAENRFIGANWTPKNFGSSAALSRVDYRTTLVRQRVLTLLVYLQNYSAGGH